MSRTTTERPASGSLGGRRLEAEDRARVFGPHQIGLRHGGRRAGEDTCHAAEDIGFGRPVARVAFDGPRYPLTMPILKSRLGDWDLDHVQAWSERTLVIGAEPVRLIEPTTKVATIGSCFASELAKMMDAVGIRGAMHPGGLFYSTATIRQELERIAGGWPERAGEPLWDVGGGWVDPFRDYGVRHPDEATLLAGRAEADAAADALFRGAGVVVVTLGLIETWRSPTSGATYRQIPHPAVFPTLGPSSTG